MQEEGKILRAEKDVEVRFSEVDSMGIVWHGTYPVYFEDAREEFGRIFSLEYLRIYDAGYFTPLVELHFNYRKPLRLHDNIKVVITYRDTDAAKIIFGYEIYNKATGELVTTGYSVQVFIDRDYNLVWETPEFFARWKKDNGLK